MYENPGGVFPRSRRPCLRYIWGSGKLKTSEYRHMGGGGLKLLKKPSYDIWTFP